MKAISIAVCCNTRDAVDCTVGAIGHAAVHTGSGFMV